MMNKKGFALIELVVVVAIIGILLVIGGFSGVMWRDKYQAESLIKTMSIDLMNARVSAMQRSRVYFMVFSPTPTATQYAIYEDDGSGAFNSADTRVVLKTFSSRYALTIPAAAATSVNVLPKGLVSMTGSALMGTEQTIRVAASFGGAYDCMVISETKIRTGAWNGTQCLVE